MECNFIYTKNRNKFAHLNVISLCLPVLNLPQQELKKKRNLKNKSIDDKNHKHSNSITQHLNKYIYSIFFDES